MVTVTTAGMQDRDTAHRLLALLREHFSTITLVWADGGYAGRLVTWAKAVLHLTITIVKTHRQHQGFRGAAPQMGGRANVVRREAPCCIPGIAGRNSEGGFWVEWLT
jgi:hypothetical protein